jgi:hypothetical protein
VGVEEPSTGVVQPESGMHGAFGLSAASSTGRLQHPSNQLIRQYFALENRSVGLYFNQNLARELFRLIQRARTIFSFLRFLQVDFELSVASTH